MELLLLIFTTVTHKLYNSPRVLLEPQRRERGRSMGKRFTILPESYWNVGKSGVFATWKGFTILPESYWNEMLWNAIPDWLKDLQFSQSLIGTCVSCTLAEECHTHYNSPRVLLEPACCSS